MHSPHLHRHQRRSTAGLHVPWISSPLSALQDPATNRASIAAELLTHHPKIQVRISLSPCLSMGFCLKTKLFLLHSQISHFFFFWFSSLIGKTPNFSVLCLLLKQYLIYNPNIHVLHSRNILGTFSKSFAIETMFDLQPIRFFIFLNTLFGCRES